MEARQTLDYESRSGVPAKKSTRDRLIELGRQHVNWVVGFLDETWWSRLSQPNLHAWSPADQPLRLIEQTVASDDPDPKALACYGLYIPAAPPGQQMWLRFVQDRPVSAVTTQFLDWCCQHLAQAGKRVLVLIWDNATRASQSAGPYLASYP